MIEHKVLNLVQDSLEKNISGENFDKTLQFLIDSDSLKSNSVSNTVCLSIPKNNTYRDSVCLSLPKNQQEQNLDFRTNIVTSDIDINE